MAESDVWRVTATFTMPLETVAKWVWHIQQVTAGTALQTQLIDAIKVVLSDAWDEIRPFIVDAVVGNNLQIALWDTVLKRFDTTRTIALTDLTGGEGAIEMLPHQDTGVVTFRTDVGRSVGKKGIFGLSEATQSNSVLNAAVTSAMALFAAAFDDSMTVGGVDYDPGNFNVPNELFRAYIKTVGANSVMGSQYRRIPGIGI